MAKLTFILGAGASAIGGCPVMSNFMSVARRLRETGELGEHAKDFDLVSKFHAYLFHNQIKSHLDVNNIEILYSAIDLIKNLNGVGELKYEESVKAHAAFARLIAVVLEKTQRFQIHFRESRLISNNQNREYFTPVVSGPEGYSELVEYLKIYKEKYPNLSVEFVTFNYDMGLETSMLLQDLQPDSSPAFASTAPDNSEYRIHKLHGSVHWYAEDGDLTGATAELVDSLAKLKDDVSDMVSHASKEYTSISFADKLISLGKRPLIVPPTDDKVRYRALHSNVWDSAARAISESDAICVLGYSMPATDLFFKLFWSISTSNQHDLRKLYLMDIDSSVFGKYKNLVGEPIRDRVSSTFPDMKGVLRSITSDLEKSEGTFSL
ncbi:MAG: hypothetical protein RLN78_08990 [Phycisphaerales bacterium]